MKLYILLLSAALTGCASKIGTTVPGEVNHQAIGTGYTDIESVEMASHTADTYCSKHGKRPAIDKLTTTYKGVVSETTRNNTDKALEVAAVAGVWLPGLGSDEDYQTIADFRCLSK